MNQPTNDITIPAHVFGRYILAWARENFPWPDLQARRIMIACSWACLGDHEAHATLMNAIEYVTRQGEN